MRSNGCHYGVLFKPEKNLFSVLKGSFFKPEKNLVVVVFQKKTKLFSGSKE